MSCLVVDGCLLIGELFTGNGAICAAALPPDVRRGYASPQQLNGRRGFAPGSGFAPFGPKAVQGAEPLIFKPVRRGVASPQQLNGGGALPLLGQRPYEGQSPYIFKPVRRGVASPQQLNGGGALPLLGQRPYEGQSPYIFKPVRRGVASPQQLKWKAGLCPWFGLCPIGPKAVRGAEPLYLQAGTARRSLASHQAAKPMQRGQWKAIITSIRRQSRCNVANGKPSSQASGGKADATSPMAKPSSQASGGKAVVTSPVAKPSSQASNAKPLQRHQWRSHHRKASNGRAVTRASQTKRASPGQTATLFLL
jgi:hypothetical protein